MSQQAFHPLFPADSAAFSAFPENSLKTNTQIFQGKPCGVVIRISDSNHEISQMFQVSDSDAEDFWRLPEQHEQV